MSFSEGSTIRILVNAIQTRTESSPALTSGHNPHSHDLRRIAIVSHDASRTGAPLIALNVARELVARGIPIVTILLASGELEPDFARLGPLFVARPIPPGAVSRDPRPGARIAAKILSLLELIVHGGERRFWERVLKYIATNQVKHAICSTVLSGPAAVHLNEAGATVIGLVHEMPDSIRIFRWTDRTTAMINGSNALIFACDQVRASFIDAFPNTKNSVFVIPQSYNLTSKEIASGSSKRESFRQGLGLAPGDVLILGCGSADLRKGVDLFIEAARTMPRLPVPRRIAFAWAGRVDENFRVWVEKDVRECDLSDRLVFLGPQENMAPCFAAADIFFLSSREDPFPTVVLEAMAYGIPIVAFARSGGVEEQISGGAGLLVPYADVSAAINTLRRLAERPDERVAFGRFGRRKIEELGGYDVYVDRLISVLVSQESEIPAEPF